METGASGWLFSIVVTVDIVILLVAIGLHLFGVYLLQFKVRSKKNQNLILTHLSAIEILLPTFRLISVFYFFSYQNERKVLAYQILRTIILEGCCVTYVFILTVVTVDPLLIIFMNVKYNPSKAKRFISYALALCWFIGFVSTSVSFSVDYETREEFTAKYTFPAWCSFFLVFTVFSYVYIYVKLKNFNQRPGSIKNTCSRRAMKVRVPFLIVTMFFIFIALPSIFQFVYKKQLTKITYGLVGIAYAMGNAADALLYIFLQSSTRKYIFRKSITQKGFQRYAPDEVFEIKGQKMFVIRRSLSLSQQTTEHSK